MTMDIITIHRMLTFSERVKRKALILFGVLVSLVRSRVPVRTNEEFVPPYKTKDELNKKFIMDTKWALESLEPGTKKYKNELKKNFASVVKQALDDSQQVATAFMWQYHWISTGDANVRTELIEKLCYTGKYAGTVYRLKQIETEARVRDAAELKDPRFSTTLQMADILRKIVEHRPQTREGWEKFLDGPDQEETRKEAYLIRDTYIIADYFMQRFYDELPRTAIVIKKFQSHGLEVKTQGKVVTEIRKENFYKGFERMFLPSETEPVKFEIEKRFGASKEFHYTDEIPVYGWEKWVTHFKTVQLTEEDFPKKETFVAVLDYLEQRKKENEYVSRMLKDMVRCTYIFYVSMDRLTSNGRTQDKDYKENLRKVTEKYWEDACRILLPVAVQPLEKFFHDCFILENTDMELDVRAQNIVCIFEYYKNIINEANKDEDQKEKVKYFRTQAKLSSLRELMSNTPNCEDFLQIKEIIDAFEAYVKKETSGGSKPSRAECIKRFKQQATYESTIQKLIQSIELKRNEQLLRAQ